MGCWNLALISSEVDDTDRPLRGTIKKTILKRCCSGFETLLVVSMTKNIDDYLDFSDYDP